MPFKGKALEVRWLLQWNVMVDSVRMRAARVF
jgi:hypothetical protein